jgi:hypothetical protein
MIRQGGRACRRFDEAWSERNEPSRLIVLVSCSPNRACSHLKVPVRLGSLLPHQAEQLAVLHPVQIHKGG